MASADSPHIETRSRTAVLARDLAALLGFSAALAVTAGLIRTPMHLPGHSAVFWMPVLVLAGAYRRPGLAAGSALLGGAASVLWCGKGALEFAGLLAAAGAVEALRAGWSARTRGLWLIVAGILGHLGKLGTKVLAALAAGSAVNDTGLLIVPTLALYAAFGLAGGALAWGALTAWDRLRPGEGERPGEEPTDSDN